VRAVLCSLTVHGIKFHQILISALVYEADMTSPLCFDFTSRNELTNKQLTTNKPMLMTLWSSFIVLYSLSIGASFPSTGPSNTVYKLITYFLITHFNIIPSFMLHT